MHLKLLEKIFLIIEGLSHGDFIFDEIANYHMEGWEDKLQSGKYVTSRGLLINNQILNLGFSLNSDFFFIYLYIFYF